MGAGKALRARLLTSCGRYLEGRERTEALLAATMFALIWAGNFSRGAARALLEARSVLSRTPASTSVDSQTDGGFGRS